MGSWRDTSKEVRAPHSYQDDNFQKYKDKGWILVTNPLNLQSVFFEVDDTVILL